MVKKNIILAILFMALLTSAPSAKAPHNGVTDPGFENNSPDWIYSGPASRTTAQHYTGSYSATLVNSFASIQQSLSIAANETIEMHYWQRGSGSLTVTLSTNTGSFDYITTTTGNDWVYVSLGAFGPPVVLISYIDFHNSSAQIWIDDVGITVADSDGDATLIIDQMDDGNNCYTMKTNGYVAVCTVYDSAGADKVTDITIRSMQGATIRWEVNATDLDTAPAFAVTQGGTIINIDPGAWSYSGFPLPDMLGALTGAINFEWDYPQENAGDLVIKTFSSGGDSGWITAQTYYYDVVSRLVTHSFIANTTSVNISKPIRLTGFVRYAITINGNTASTSYPPDSEFTSVSIIDDLAATVGTDAAIVDGYFDCTFNSADTFRTTYYHAYLNLNPDYTDGPAADADIVAVVTTTMFPIVDFLGNAFAFFGLAGAVTGTIYTMLFAFIAWFQDAALAMVNMATAVLALVLYTGGAVIGWTARMANFFVTLLTFISSFFDGSMFLGGTNWWVAFNFAAWIDVIPVFAFIIWYGGLGSRASRSGRSATSVFIGDLQVASYIIGEVWGWTSTVFYFVLNTINLIASRF